MGRECEAVEIKSEVGMKIKAEAASFVKNEGELEKKLEHVLCFIHHRPRSCCKDSDAM
jgi:hypothetical protein